MENYNNFEQKNSSSAWEVSQSEIQSFSLEYLNETAADVEASSQKIEQSKDRILEIFDRSERESSFENQVENLREMSESRGRENSNFFQKDVPQSEEWSQYGGFMESYAGREGFVARNENRERTQQSLSQEISNLKGQVRSVDFSQKMSNFGRAIFGKVA